MSDGSKKGESYRHSHSYESFSLKSKLINGTIGGFLGVVALFPLDSIKTRMQSQKIPIYRSWFHGLQLICRTEGFLGLYHGCGVTMFLVTPEICVKLVTFDYMKHRLQSPSGELTLAQRTYASAVAGLAQIHITTPSELIKVQLQTNVIECKRFPSKTQYALNTWQVIKTIYTEHGLLGFYRGYVLTALRDITFAMIYFPLYALIIDYGPANEKEPDRPADWVAFIGGLISGLTAGIAVTPFDVIKTRFQTHNKKSTGIMHSFRRILCSQDGIKALFSGVTCRAISIGPLLGICQMVYSYDLAGKLVLP